MNKDELIKKLTQENENLKVLLTEEKRKNTLKEEVCIQQSKMAVMGEMIESIAHQWRQPLMELSSILMLLQSKIEFEQKVSKSDIIETINKSDTLAKYMSSTIDDFRNFFSKEKRKVEFKISDQVKRIVNILSYTLKNRNIKVNIIVKSNPTVLGLKNEYTQALINIISNAKDALIHRNIENGLIEVRIYKEGDDCITEISDNAGGIKEEYLKEIFNPFKTFEKKDGTGVGLFMSKLIIENNMGGKLSVENSKEGAKFKIVIPIKH